MKGARTAGGGMKGIQPCETLGEIALPSGEIYEINGNLYCGYSDLSIYAREWDHQRGWVWRPLFVDLEDQ